jgi:hypothetical protein
MNLFSCETNGLNGEQSISPNQGCQRARNVRRRRGKRGHPMYGGEECETKDHDETVGQGHYQGG